MSAMVNWDQIIAERTALADDLADLSGEAWQTTSWCTGWTVEQVLAHLVSAGTMTPVRFVTEVVRARFNRHRMVERVMRTNTGATPQQTLQRYREVIEVRWALPGMPLSPLGEVVLHGEDVRQPLGISHEYPAEVLTQLLDFYTSTNRLLGAKHRVEGLHLLASDDVYSFGGGARVEGPLLSLLLAASGRVGACDDLAGPGVPTLRRRCS